MAKIDIVVAGKVDDAVQGLKQVDGTLANLGGETKKASLSLTDLKSGLDLASGAFNAVRDTVKSVIDPVVVYGKQVRDLSAFTGVSNEESSKLIQVADDLQIEYGTLRTAARKLVEDGLQPNIENLGKLSDEYLAIQDPVERSQFLVETFGSRAGPEMARLLEQGSAAIEGMAQEAADLGLVLDEQAVEATHNYEKALDDFDDSVLAVKIALSEGLLPAITDVVKQGATFVQYWNEATEVIIGGKVSLLEWQKLGYEVIFTDKTLADGVDELRQKNEEYSAASDLAAHTLRENYEPATEDATAAVEGNTSAVSTGIDVYGEYITTLTTGVTPAVQGVADDTNLATAAMRDYTTELFFNEAMASLDKDAQLVLAAHLGLVDEKTLSLMTSLPKLTEQFDTSGDGAVSGSEDVQGYIQALLDLAANLDALDGKTVNTYVNTNYTATGYNLPDNSNSPTPYASGGDYQPGGPMIVGERGPEIIWPQLPGSVMNNNELSRMVVALEGLVTVLGTGNLGQTINVYGNGSDSLARAYAGAF